MPHRLQRRAECGDRRLRLQLDRRTQRQHMRQVDGRLGREVPIQQPHQRLRHIADDARPARRPHDEGQPPLRIEDQRGRHGRARPLARRRRIGHRPSIDFGAEGEIGQLIVQHEAAHHHLRAEHRLDGRRHGHGAAGLVDDGDVAGPKLGLLLLRSMQRGLAPGRVAGARLEGDGLGDERAEGEAFVELVTKRTSRGERVEGT